MPRLIIQNHELPLLQAQSGESMSCEIRDLFIYFKEKGAVSEFQPDILSPERVWQFSEVLIKCAYTVLFPFRFLKSYSLCSEAKKNGSAQNCIFPAEFLTESWGDIVFSPFCWALIKAKWGSKKAGVISPQDELTAKNEIVPNCI